MKRQIFQHRFSRHGVTLNLGEALGTIENVLEVEAGVLGERAPEDVRQIEEHGAHGDGDRHPLVI